MLLKSKLKSQTSIRAIRGCDASTMEHDRMLDYRQSQTCTALAAGTAFIHSVESLKDPRKVLFINTGTVIFEDEAPAIYICIDLTFK